MEKTQATTFAKRAAEARAQGRNRAIGAVGPLAIIVISLIVGGLIVSVMTALLSVYQVVD
jgi:general secretion pathway protein F